MKVSLLFAAALLAVSVSISACASKKAVATAKAEPAQVAPTETNATSEAVTMWMKIDPVQCQMNPWEQGAPAVQQGEDRAKREEALLRDYLEKKVSVSMLGYMQKRTMENVCDACSCPRGDTIWIMIDEDDSAKLAPQGWKPAEGEGM